ncbi:MAG TPA: metallophosphoesterase [Candidatus Sulfotelmatobacter sp.]|jgi:3',5'-cyclic AMP phosphodiesterase CpdA|nr:metallophosphoesterase [Candidatus Sulfotelmatobacter sp.]
MKRLRIFLAGLVCCSATFLAGASPGVVTIAQISDTHLGERHSLNAAENLRLVVKMINARHPDAVILSGDIGENQEEREQVKIILEKLAAPIYYVPGNHEFHDTNGLAHYRKQFGPDYYRFHVKNVEVLALDTQLLGNYEKFAAKTNAPLSPGLEAESEKMLDWMAQQAEPTRGRVVIAVQHIPLFRDNDFPDAKPYWTVNVPYARRETDLLHALGVKHLLAGHWHNGRVFEQNGITIHVAPATSWLPLGGKLGFALHSIDTGGDVHTEFVALPGSAY